MTKNICSEVTLENPYFKLKIGTINKKNPTTFYVEGGTFITPVEPEDDEMSYSQFLEYQKQYEKDRAEMGAAEGWQQKAQAFVRDKGISDGNSPQCPAPRVQIWGMLFKFYGVIIADVKQLIREAIK